MSLVCIQEQYPGYTKRLFECPLCGGTMTQWAGASPPSDFNKVTDA